MKEDIQRDNLVKQPVRFEGYPRTGEENGDSEKRGGRNAKKKKRSSATRIHEKRGIKKALKSGKLQNKRRESGYSPATGKESTTLGRTGKKGGEGTDGSTRKLTR